MTHKRIDEAAQALASAIHDGEVFMDQSLLTITDRLIKLESAMDETRSAMTALESDHQQHMSMFHLMTMGGTKPITERIEVLKGYIPDSAACPGQAEIMDMLRKENAALVEENLALKSSKDNAYRERNLLVRALSRMFRSRLCRHQDSDKDWEDDWRWIVIIDSPSGQLSWHIHDSELDNFKHLPVLDNNWDGHTTEEKYQRLRDIPSLRAVTEGWYSGILIHCRNLAMAVKYPPGEHREECPVYKWRFDKPFDPSNCEPCPDCECVRIKINETKEAMRRGD